MDLTWVSYIAAVFTTVSFMPQVIKTWRTRKTKDLSLPMYIIVAIGSLLWFTYGLSKQDTAIVFTNAIVFILSLTILFLKIKNG